MTSTPSSSANIDFDAIDAMVGVPVDVGGKLTLTAETNPNTNPADKNLQAIATDTQGAGTANAEVGQTAAIVNSQVEAGDAVQLIATETLGLSADATTTSNKATATATLGTTPRTDQTYTNGGILGSNITANGEFYVNSLVNNETTATASSTSNNGGIAAEATATLSDSFGIVDSNISVGGGSDVNVKNNDVLTGNASTTSDDAKATITRGEVTGIKFSDSQKFQSSGSADIDVEVGTDGKIGASEIDPNIASAVATVHGAGDARATLITGSNYGITGRDGGSTPDPEQLDFEDGNAQSGDPENNFVKIVLDESFDGTSITLQDVQFGSSGTATSPDDADYLATFTNESSPSTTGADVRPIDPADIVGTPETFSFDSDPAPGDITLDTPSSAFNVIYIQSTDGSAINGDSFIIGGVEGSDGPIPFTAFGATIKINGDGTINAEVANTFTTTADTIHGDSTATSKTSGDAGDKETIGIDLKLADIKGNGDINGVVDNTQKTDAATTTGDANATSQAGLTKGIRADAINIGGIANIKGDVHTVVETAASTHGGGNATANAKSFNPNAATNSFGGEKIGVNAGNSDGVKELNIDGGVNSKFDVDASNHHGNAKAHATELQVTGVLASQLTGGKIDVDGNASLDQDTKATTTTGNATATVTSGPDLSAQTGFPKLDGVTGIAVTNTVDSQGLVNINGVVDYDGKAVTESVTGNATSNVGTGAQGLQDMVGTLLVTPNDVNSNGDMTINGQATAMTTSSATTTTGTATAEINSDPIKGIKSNPGVNYQSGSDLTVNGQAIFSANVDSISIGGNMDASGWSVDGSGWSMDGSGGYIDASGGYIDASGGYIDASGGYIDASGGYMDASGGYIDASGGYMDASGGYMDASGGYMDASGGYIDASGGYMDASGGYMDASGGYMDASGGYMDASGGYMDASGGYMDASGGYIDASGGYMDASGGYMDASGGYMDASGGYMDASGGYIDASGGYMDASGGYMDDDANKLIADGAIDADGHANTTLDAKALNTHGAATANTVTGLQKGLIVSNNSSGFGGPNPNVIDGATVDLSGTVNSTAIAHASTNGGGNATANAKAERPNLTQTFGAEKVGVDIDRTNSKGIATVNGQVISSFDVDANNIHGAATASTQEQQVTGVLGTDLIAKGAIDVDGTATVNQNAKAVTHGGGTATANVISGPDFDASGGLAMGQLSLDGVTGIAYTGTIDGQSNVDLDGIVSYTGSADAQNTTGNATASVGDNSQSLQDMVGTLLVTPGNVNSNGDMTINGQATAMTTSSATTTTGTATAEINSDPIKGIKSNPGVNYQSGSDLTVNGQAIFSANVDSISIGGNMDASGWSVDGSGWSMDGSGGYMDASGGSIANATLENAVGTDLSDLNSAAPFDASGGYMDASGGYMDASGGYMDASGGYMDSSGGSIANATLENAVGTDLSDLNSAAPFDASGGYMDASGGYMDDDANKLIADGAIDADGHANTTLDAKALNTHGAATANTVTGLQKGLIVSNNSSGFGGPNPNVIDGATVDLSGTVNSTAIAHASTNGGGNATANAKAERPNLTQTFGAEKVGVDIDRTNSKGIATVNGQVISSFDVDANNIHGAATASTQEQQVTGVLGTDLIAKGAIDVDGTATVNQNAKAVTHGGGTATANVISGPDFDASGGLAMGQLSLDGVTGIAYTGTIDGQSNVDLDGIVSYTGSADAQNTTGNATASVGDNSQSLQDMVGTLLVTPGNVNSNGDMTINGQATAMTTSSATTTTGTATAEINSDPIKGIKSNPGVNYQSGSDLTVNGQAIFSANVDSISIGGNMDASGWSVDGSGWSMDGSGGYIDASGGYIDASGGYIDASGGYMDASGGYMDASGGYMDASGGYMDASGGSIANATLENAVGTDLSDLNSAAPFDASGGYIDASGGYMDASGGYMDASGGYMDASGGYMDASGGYMDASGGYMDASGGYMDDDANKLIADGAIDADGHANTTLDAKALNTHGAATANTVTGLQKGLIVSNNSSGFGGPNPNVIDGATVDLSGTVNSTAIAHASTNGGGNATANAKAERPNLTQTFGAEKVGVDIDRTNSKGIATVNGQVISSFDVDANNIHGAATASTQEQQVTGVLGTDLIAKGAIDVDGTATVNQNAKAVTHGGGTATANVISGPDFDASGGLAMGQLSLDGVTGIAYTGTIDGQSNVDLDGIVSYTGSADAQNTTGNATASVGDNSQSLQDMVGTLLVTPGNVNSNGDMTINGQATAMTTSSATTTTGTATAEINSDPVKGIKTIPGVELQSDGGLIIDGLAQIGTDATATAIGGTGNTSRANSQVTNVVGVDMSDLDSVTENGIIKASAKGDLEFKGVASTNLNSNSNITTGNAFATSISEFVSGINAGTIIGDANGNILGSAFNTSKASATTIGEYGASNRADAEVSGGEDSEVTFPSKTIGITLNERISIGGAGNVVGEGMADGYSHAYGTTAETIAIGSMKAQGIQLSNGSNIEIKGSGENLGDVTGTGYIGTTSYNNAGYITLSPFNVEATTTTGDSTSLADFTALGISSDTMNGSINTVNGNITGTGAAVIDATSKTHNGTSTATSMTDIFGIQATNLEIKGTGNTITGYALGNINTEAINTNGNANATSTISNGIGIDGGSSGINATVIGEINGIADISQTVMAKTVTGNATATATSGPVIGIRNTNIYSAGDLTITANASLNSTAYSETIGGM